MHYSFNRVGSEIIHHGLMHTEAGVLKRTIILLGLITQSLVSSLSLEPYHTNLEAQELITYISN